MRSILLCGDTKEGKTTSLAQMALWLYERFGIRTRLITADGGGSKVFEDLGLIEHNIVEQFSLLDCDVPIAWLNRLSKGFWPKCDADGNVTLKSGPDYMEDFAQSRIGAYMFDSITGCAELLGQHASRPEANVAFKLGTVSQEDGYNYGTLAEGHYQVVHSQLRSAFELQFRRLPIHFLVVTARLDKQEGFNKQSKYFPKTLGKAIASDIPSWFEDCFHLSTELVTGSVLNSQLSIEAPPDEVLECKVMWIKSHRDRNTGIEYSCGYRIAPAGIPYIEKKYKEGYVVLDLNKGIANWLEYMEAVNKTVRTKVNVMHERLKETANNVSK